MTPRYPALYQLDTRVWQTERSRAIGRPATFDDLSDEELDRLAALGFDWLWPLSVWQTGAAGQHVSRSNLDWRREFEETLLSLLRLGAMMPSGAAGPVWQQRVSEARESGLSFEEIVEALTALAPTIGIDRTVAVAPELARALGYDIDAALERLDDPALS